MNVSFLYSTAPGRLLLKGILHSRLLSAVAGFLRSPASRVMIRPYIWRNHIDMYDFRGKKFQSFADFFARKRDWISCEGDGKSLISPCDSRLSIFPVSEDASFRVKGSRYRISDLIPDREIAEQFMGGFCLIYRLEASDYHHFCYIDDCKHSEGHRIEGTLHSVQPSACAREPVYRLNRRVWSLMETENFGTVAQIEVGALLVGGIVHEKKGGCAKRGEEMGHFELAGSTVIQFFTKDARTALRLLPEYKTACRGGKEVRVRQGQMIGEKRK